MRNPLNKRILRELKSELPKYTILVLFLVTIIGFISGFLVASGSLRIAYDEGFEKYNVHLDFIADNLGQDVIKGKAQQIYAELSDEVKEQVVQYQNGARNKSWMLNRCNLKYIVDNNLF